MRRVILLIILSINIMYCKEIKIFGRIPDYSYDETIINQIFCSPDNEDCLKNLTTGNVLYHYIMMEKQILLFIMYMIIILRIIRMISF